VARPLPNGLGNAWPEVLSSGRIERLRMRFPLRQRVHRAVTLVELLAAIGIIGFMTIAFAGALSYNVQSIEANRRVAEALQVAQFYEGRLFGSTYQALGDPDIDSGAWEAQFADTQEYVVEEAGQQPRTYTISFRHTGWGAVGSATASTMTADFPENQEEWITNEWAGQYLVITRGRGAGQIMRILSNTADTLSLTRDLTGAQAEDWTVIPDSSSRYNINNSKTVEVTITWGGPRREEAFRRVVTIPRPAGRSLQ